MSPAVSVMLPVFDGERYLDEAIRSVRDQTFPDLELVVWDDGSQDASREIILRHAAEDPRVRLVGGEHRGVAGALAAAHAHARGDYVCYLDQDDVLEPDALQATLGVLGPRPEVGMVYTDHVGIDADGRELGLGHRCRIPYSPEGLLLAFMTFHFRLVRAEVFRRAGGIDTAYEQCADYDLCLRLSEVTGVAHLRRPLYRYRVHGASVSHRQALAQREAAARAVRAALARRGLADELELHVDDDGQFRLEPRSLAAETCGDA